MSPFAMLIKSPPVRVLVAVIVLLPVVAVSVALTVLLFSASRSISTPLGNTIVEAETARVTDEVEAYLSEAVRVSDLYARRLAHGTLPLSGLTAWEPLMADDLFTSKRIASICFGNRQGESTYLQLAHGRRELGRVSGPLDKQAYEYEVDVRGQIIGSPLRHYQYDARQRPWYRLALRSAGPRWTAPYFWFGTAGGETETGCGYTRVITDADGRYVGVLTIDVTLGALSDFLHRLPFARTGHIFIIDSSGMLVAASHGAVNSVKGERLQLRDSSEPVAKLVADALRRTGESALATKQAMAIVANGAPAHVRVTAQRPFPGIDWRIITVVPEATFLADARSAERRAIATALAATVGALGLSLLLGRRIAVPLRRLTAHVARIGAGDFASRLHLAEARELSQLATATNAIAGGLKHRMELEQSMALAMQVQQSLLPQDIVPPRGLDIAAVSRFCDGCGGDYFAVIDIPGDHDGRVLIAVGDVTGHGIAAALLMATARATLRTAAMAHAAPGPIMTKINAVLSANPNRQRYMTMMLLTIDPHAQDVRWASAGHDPTIVYDPTRDEFAELGDSGLLLAAVDDVTYVEHACGHLRRGTILFVGTDGVWETRDPGGAMYGKDRLRAFIKSHAHRPAADIARDLERDLTAFRAGRAATDDLTYVVVKMVGTPAPREAHRGRADIAQV